MLDIQKLRDKKEHTILVLGRYPTIIQSILDYDFLSGKEKPSLVGILAGGRKNERYFFGEKEILLPFFQSFEEIPEKIKNEITLFLNLTSGRRVLQSSLAALNLPRVVGGVVFAENVPEIHALSLFQEAQTCNKFIIGPASVGLLLPQKLKLGAIGGVSSRQLMSSNILTPGNVAVFSSSGGMTNELINIVTSNGHRISFALSFGGDRFPITSPKDAFLAAQKDRATDYIVYFGELGGYDEYEIAELLKKKEITKPVICYIGGVISEMFATPPQFGHAKAMAGRPKESAVEKRKALEQAGASVAHSFTEFVQMVGKIPLTNYKSEEYDMIQKAMTDRKHALIATTISSDVDGDVTILGEGLLPFAKNHSFGYIVGTLFLGKKLKSKDTEHFIDFILRLLVDHGPYVSGAVTTIITARAGRDLVSSLASGLLTIGPRFGGAINEAARNWLQGVMEAQQPSDFVEAFAQQKKLVAGIGHKKYRIDFPDPRVKEILHFAPGKKRFTSFAKSVESITVAKKGNLILNVDGAIAAVLLDILHEKEGYTEEDLLHLVETEFFNALFVLSRSVGFIAHFLDQKRLDEGLFRLPDEDVTNVS